ncbi:MAG: chalcone isomerase family protein [Bacteroidota bacterium]
MKILIALSLVFTTSYFVKAQESVTIDGVAVPKKITVDGTNLFKNGAGTRSKYGFKLYVGALYLKMPSKDANKIINDDHTMAMHLHIISDKVTREKFLETVSEGFNSISHGKATEAQKSTLKGFFSDPFKKGDKIRLEYVAGTGVKVYKNGVYKGVVAGLEFKKALFSIWLGTKPPSAELKNKLLGKV